jgi:hypothetical protein
MPSSIDFPDNPTPGQEFTLSGRSWTWNNDKGVWESSLQSEFPPSPHAETHEEGGSDEIQISPEQVFGTAIVEGDSRLEDSRDPNSHAATHESGGTDEIEISQSQVIDLIDDLEDKANIDEVVSTTNGVVTTASTSETVVRNITLSTSAPSGGMDGDIWLEYTP